MTNIELLESPQELPKADVLIITATKVEALAVLRLVPQKSSPHLNRQFIGNKTYYNLGRIGGAKIFLVQSGMGSSGPGGSLLTVVEGIRSLRPSAVIMVGIAFGLKPKKQRIGEVLVSQQLLAYEFQRIGNSSSNTPEIRMRGDRPRASTWLLDRFTSGALDWKEAEVRFGLLLSGEKLIDHQGFRDQLLRFEPEAIGGEMEGAGLYTAAHQYKVDWIVIKAICDWADGKKSQNKQRRQQTAAYNAAKFTLHVLGQGGFNRSQVTTSHPPSAVNWESPLPRAKSSSIKTSASSPVETKSGNGKLEDKNVHITSLYMAGDYLQSYIQAEIAMANCIKAGDIENASLFLSAMITTRRGQGLYSAGLNLIEKWSQCIPLSKLSEKYRLRILKEKLAIAHETSRIDLALSILEEIKRLDPSRELCPPGDDWLPGVVFWRESHILQIKKCPKPQEALSLAATAIQWYQSIKSDNPSGLASALLNAGWLLYTHKDSDCLDYFMLAKELAAHYSPRTYIEAEIGEGVARLKFDVSNWHSSSLQIIKSLLELETIGCASRNYAFLKEEVSPEKIIENEFRKYPERAFELFIESLRNTLLQNSDFHSPHLQATIPMVDRNNEINILLKKNN